MHCMLNVFLISSNPAEMNYSSYLLQYEVDVCKNKIKLLASTWAYIYILLVTLCFLVTSKCFFDVIKAVYLNLTSISFYFIKWITKVIWLLLCVNLLFLISCIGSTKTNHYSNIENTKCFKFMLRNEMYGKVKTKINKDDLFFIILREMRLEFAFGLQYITFGKKKLSSSAY